MPLTRMEHYLVLSDDMEATKRFYCDALGLLEGPRPAFPFLGFWLYLGDIPCIHVADWITYGKHSENTGLPMTRRAHSTGSLDHIAFTAEDYDGVLARLEKHGIEIGKNDVPGGRLRQLFLTDPNGIKIELNFRIAA
jgi:catechol 2,3-dioxygenase-like lactoylglutathione lyase family enzyme